MSNDIDLGSKDDDVRILETCIWWCNDLGILEMKLMMIVVGLKLMMILEVKLIPVMILEVKLMMWADVTCHIIYLFTSHITQFFELSSNSSKQCPQTNTFLSEVTLEKLGSSLKLAYPGSSGDVSWCLQWNCWFFMVSTVHGAPCEQCSKPQAVIPGWLIEIPLLDDCNPQ